MVKFPTFFESMFGMGVCLIHPETFTVQSLEVFFPRMPAIMKYLPSMLTEPYRLVGRL